MRMCERRRSIRNWRERCAVRSRVHWMTCDEASQRGRAPKWGTSGLLAGGDLFLGEALPLDRDRPPDPPGLETERARHLHARDLRLVPKLRAWARALRGETALRGGGGSGLANGSGEVDRGSPVSYPSHIMAVLTIRVSEEAKAQLDRRAKESGVSVGRLLKEMERRLGDQSQRVRRRK